MECPPRRAKTWSFVLENSGLLQPLFFSFNNSNLVDIFKQVVDVSLAKNQPNSAEKKNILSLTLTLYDLLLYTSTNSKQQFIVQHKDGTW